MERTYTLNEIAMMSGFTTRTLRTYLNQGILNGKKNSGKWEFRTEDIEKFFADPYVKEGLRIKRTGIVFDFLAERRKGEARSCVILDVPASLKEGNALSEFFCKEMEQVSDTFFTFDWDGNECRVILCGAEDQVAKIMKAYYGRM
ncbi:MAG: helix-turn-helix domain-containing protein [Solobacterium sp.]|nr:helix-turn-helix domain-containing protein [Solobacterium sp.]